MECGMIAFEMSGLVAQQEEHPPCKRGVVGSNPTGASRKMKKIKIITSSEPNKDFVNINLLNRNGILRKSITYGVMLRETNYVFFGVNGETYFKNYVKDVFISGKNKLLEELKTKDTINLVTIDGKENFYSKILKEVLSDILKEEGFEVI
ncbi:hypothetical protein TMA_060 [Thermus phage TMA]|uniref:hypothetical protein n=1 Tax=Thermus phage TMA TaxID=699370 RepID=UPI00021AAE4B|nr:hypothetical protein TMA_060 [Thermus phage TMA]BAK53748.1 hypothetical protein TMA_060 [Thermus phage TMA]